MNLTRLSALEVAAAIKAGETTSEAVTRALLERIEEREPAVDAWEYLNPDAVPSRFICVDNFPKSSNGKVQKYLLRRNTYN